MEEGPQPTLYGGYGCINRLGGWRGSGSFSGVKKPKMDFEDLVGVSGSQSRRGFRENQRHVQRHWGITELECEGPPLPKSRGPASVAEDAGKVG